MKSFAHEFEASCRALGLCAARMGEWSGDGLGATSCVRRDGHPGHHTHDPITAAELDRPDWRTDRIGALVHQLRENARTARPMLAHDWNEAADTIERLVNAKEGEHRSALPLADPRADRDQT